VIYGVVYIIATLLLAPGSVLTLAAGAVFGLLWGVITVSVASTIAAAFAFLIARYLARDRVARRVRQNPKFDAVDRAIGEGGWKIVAMLRLSPAVPFNLQNYLYGLTPIRFFDCVLASWLAMLPGTFMYVYLGYAGREAAEAAAEGSAHWGKWALLGVGLIATVLLTVYVTRLARKKLDEQTEIVDEDENADEEPDADDLAPWLALAVAGLALAAATTVQLQQEAVNDRLKQLFGPAPLAMEEVHAPRPDGPKFDHTAFDTIVKAHVDARGLVDYAAIAENPANLDRYLDQLADAEYDRLGRDEKIALLINAYNAFTIKLITEHLDRDFDSIKDIPAPKRWDARRWQIGDNTWSLNQIEHEQIRP
ncbi:MAG: VTT domain-containing protein, partial [Phycisphaeraceae bacterium]|nr:VTT domain-containing protein [Phycisphaeraceae bacterium]